MTPTYEQRLAGFDWQLAADELGWREGEPLNIGWHCSDRICSLGLADKTALLWEDFRGEERRYTFDDLRAADQHLRPLARGAGRRAGRAGLPVHGPGPRAVPRLPGRAEDGRHRPAAVLRLRRGVAVDPAGQRRHQRHRHPAEARAQGAQDPSSACPQLRHVVVVDARPGQAAQGARDGPRPARPAPRSTTSTCTRPPPRRPRCCTTPPAPPASPRAPSTCTARCLRQYLTTKWVLDLRADDIYWCTADPAGSPAPATASSAPGPTA